MLLQMAELNFFMANIHVCVCVCVCVYVCWGHIFSIHSSFGECSGSFHILTIVNNAAVNSGIHAFFWISVCLWFFFLDVYLGVELLYYVVVLFLGFCYYAFISSYEMSICSFFLLNLLVRVSFKGKKEE